MRAGLAAIVFVLASATTSFAWKCGDSPCPGGNVCVKCPGDNCDYCLKGFVAPDAIAGVVIEEKTPGAAAKLRAHLGGFTPR